MKYIHPKIIRQIFILLLILLIGGLIMLEMAPYFSGVLGTITLFVLLKKPMKKLVGKGWNPVLSASLLMVMSFFIILLPISGALLMLGNKISKALDNSEKLTSIIKSQIQYFENLVGYKFSSQVDASAVSEWLSGSLQGFVGGTFNTAIAISIMYFLLYYMLTNQKKLYKSLFDYVPISNKNLTIIGEEIRDIVKANTLGIPLVALAQGVVALIGFLIFGIENPFFLGSNGYHWFHDSLCRQSFRNPSGLYTHIERWGNFSSLGDSCIWDRCGRINGQHHQIVRAQKTG